MVRIIGCALLYGFWLLPTTAMGAKITVTVTPDTNNPNIIGTVKIVAPAEFAGEHVGVARFTVRVPVTNPPQKDLSFIEGAIKKLDKRAEHSFDLSAQNIPIPTDQAGLYIYIDKDGKTWSTAEVNQGGKHDYQLMPPQATGEEQSNGYIPGSNVDGTVDVNFGKTWYLPNGLAQDDHLIVDTFGGALNLPQNPDPDPFLNANTQFIGALNTGDGRFPRAQLNFDFSAYTVWMVSYDICVSHHSGTAVKNNISSFSLQPSDTGHAYFTQLNRWHHPALANRNGRWATAFLVFDRAGNGPMLGHVKGKPARELLQNHWYNITIVFDLSSIRSRRLLIPI
jgi:hypothetical protein